VCANFALLCRIVSKMKTRLVGDSHHEKTTNDVCSVGNCIGIALNGEKNILWETICNVERRGRGGMEL
jgi:hypothetical protein